MGLEPLTSEILVRCSTNWTMKFHWKKVKCEFNIYPLYEKNEIMYYAVGIISPWFLPILSCRCNCRINKWLCAKFGSCSEPIKANKIISYRTRHSQHRVRTAAVRRRVLATDRYANLIFVEVNHLSLQDQKRQQAFRLTIFRMEHCF